MTDASEVDPDRSGKGARGAESPKAATPRQAKKATEATAGVGTPGKRGKKKKRRSRGGGKGQIVANGDAAITPATREGGLQPAGGWKRVDQDSVGVAGGTWNLAERDGRSSEKQPSSSSSPSPLPRVEPIVVSYEGLGAYLVTTSGPVLRVHRLPEGKCGPEGRCRAHEGTIVSLAAVPAAVNRLQAMTLARCLTIVVWDVARAMPLAKLKVEDLLELQPNLTYVPLGLALGVGGSKESAHAVGWICLQTENKESGNKSTQVRSFPLHFANLLRARGSRRGGQQAKASAAARKLQGGQPRALAASNTGGLVAAADQSTAYLWKPSIKPEDALTLHHTKVITTLAVSPGENFLAVGDDRGQVLVYNLHQADPLWNLSREERRKQAGSRTEEIQPSTFHWHSSAVLSLEWGALDETGLAPDVHHLYSGGSECTLVIWELPEGKRSYLPRFPAPLLSLKGCHSQREEIGMESFLAVGCADNSIVVVNVATKSKVCTVAGLQVPYDRVVSLGVNKQGRAEVSLLMSSRGALQRYDLDQDCQVSKLSVSYNQDHAPYARSTGKRGPTKPKLGGASTTMVSYCCDEKHLCTLEQNADGLGAWLKFWRFNPSTQRYEVERTVLNPHEGKVVCLLGHGTRALAATTSTDGKFKLWARVDGDWVCSCQARSPSSYLKACTFSGSGDVLAASFGDSLGFWDTGSLDLMAVLRCPPSLSATSFTEVCLVSKDKPAFACGVWASAGKGNCRGISVWNLLTLKHAWSMRFEGGGHLCCVSTGSDRFAVSVATRASKDSKEDSTRVLFFSARSSEPERIWHVSAFATRLFSVSGEVVIATKEGSFLSQSFATKVPRVEEARGTGREGLRAIATATASEDPEEKGLQATVEEAEGTTDFGASVPSLLSKYQDTPSHDLPAMSVLFEGLMS